MCKINRYAINTLAVLAIGGVMDCCGAPYANMSTNAGAANANMSLNTGMMNANMPETTNSRQCALRDTLDTLWEEHVMWTRQFIVSSVAGLGDAALDAQRLLKNQDDIGNAIVPFYGKKAGADLAKLLRQHISIYADIVKFAIAQNNKKVDSLYTQWYANAAAIAKFLSKLNPKNWTEQELKAMLNEHLKLTGQELQLRLQGNWAADIANYDQIFKQAHMMGDALAEGIIKQFPNKV